MTTLTTTITASTNAGIVLDPATYGSPVTIDAGITITNQGKADAVYTSGAAYTFVLQNNGSIFGSGLNNVGVSLSPGGSITNATSGLISGVYAVEIGGGAGTVTNYGRIAAYIASVGTGVHLGAGGSVTNAASASIVGGFEGVFVDTGIGTVVNDGKIESKSYEAVHLGSFGSVTNASSGSITGVGGVDLSAGGTLRNAGTIVGSGGTAVAFGGTGNNLLVLDAGFVFSGAVAGSATAANTLELASAASVGTVAGLGTLFTNFGAILFDAGAQWSIAGHLSGLTGTISGFAAGDTIELDCVTATGSSYVGGILTIDVIGGLATLDLPGIFNTTSFNVTNNADGVAVTLACFCSGTRLLTVSGEVAVDALAPGDTLVTASGRLQPVRWIGSRRIETARISRPHEVMPIRITAHALAPGMPHRDLLVSPDHALFLDGVLIPARHLCNGTTVREEAVEAVEYYHVELERHDVLLAEGVPCESYLDTGNRAAFAETVHGADDRLTVASTRRAFF